MSFTSSLSLKDILWAIDTNELANAAFPGVKPDCRRKSSSFSLRNMSIFWDITQDLVRKWDVLSLVCSFNELELFILEGKGMFLEIQPGNGVRYKIRIYLLMVYYFCLNQAWFRTCHWNMAIQTIISLLLGSALSM